MSANPSWPEPALPVGQRSLVVEPPLSPPSQGTIEPQLPVIAAPAPDPIETQPAPEPIVAPQAPAVETFPALSPDPEPVLPPAAAVPLPVAVTHYVVLIRLDGGERIQVTAHSDEAAARAEATALMRYLRDGRGDWPFVAGRFVRPERIVSVDIDQQSP